MGCDGMDWINLAQDSAQWHDVGTAMKLRVGFRKRQGIS